MLLFPNTWKYLKCSSSLSYCWVKCKGFLPPWDDFPFSLFSLSPSSFCTHTYTHTMRTYIYFNYGVDIPYQLQQESLSPHLISLYIKIILPEETCESLDKCAFQMSIGPLHCANLSLDLGVVRDSYSSPLQLCKQINSVNTHSKLLLPWLFP